MYVTILNHTSNLTKSITHKWTLLVPYIPLPADDCLHLRNQCMTGQSMAGFCSPGAVHSLCCVIERLGPDLGVSGGPCPSFLLRRADNEADTPINGQIGAWMFSQENEHLNNGNRCV